jgi:hypothetical protein
MCSLRSRPSAEMEAVSRGLLLAFIATVIEQQFPIPAPSCQHALEMDNR